MRPVAAGLLAALLLAGLASCTSRDRLNPLDPHNAKTGGTIPGFNAVAGDSVVELRWTPLLQQGVIGYRIQRWKPGEPSRLLGAADYPAHATAGEDREVRNDTTYVYRLIAHLASGDSAVSPPDTATPGRRRVVVLAAETVSFAGFAPDLRDLLFQVEANAPFQDMELDRKTGVLWMVADFITGGEVRRFLTNGTAIGEGAQLARPTDVSVGGNRGVAWVASPEEQAVVAYAAASPSPAELLRVIGVGHPRVVEAGSLDPSVWIGTEEGVVHRASPTTGAIVGTWPLGAPVLAIAMDEAGGAAWAAVRTDRRYHDLYRITEADSVARLIREGLDNVADLAVDAATGDLWVSERGLPRGGAGAVRRLNAAGVEQMAVGGLEPYGIDVDPLDRTCWVTELTSSRVIRLARDGSKLQISIPIPVPYAVRAHPR